MTAKYSADKFVVLGFPCNQVGPRILGSFPLPPLSSPHHQTESGSPHLTSLCSRPLQQPCQCCHRWGRGVGESG